FYFLLVSSTTSLYTLSLHDALPIFIDLQPSAGKHHAPRVHLVHQAQVVRGDHDGRAHPVEFDEQAQEPARKLWIDVTRWFVGEEDRKSTRLNSSHVKISYAVFCLKK